MKQTGALLRIIPKVDDEMAFVERGSGLSSYDYSRHASVANGNPSI